MTMNFNSVSYGTETVHSSDWLDTLNGRVRGVVRVFLMRPEIVSYVEFEPRDFAFEHRIFAGVFVNFSAVTDLGRAFLRVEAGTNCLRDMLSIEIAGCRKELQAQLNLCAFWILMKEGGYQYDLQRGSGLYAKRAV